jgi:hypothetical protein
MAKNETVDYAYCFNCHLTGDFVLQPDGRWQCSNCHSFREIATKTETETEAGNLADSSISTKDKVSFVKAKFKPALVKWEKKHGEIDGEQLTWDLQKAIAQLNNDGYEIVSVTPVISGYGTYKAETGAFGYSYGYGYSYTEGVIIVARKI